MYCQACSKFMREEESVVVTLVMVGTGYGKRTERTLCRECGPAAYGISKVCIESRQEDSGDVTLVPQGGEG